MPEYKTPEDEAPKDKAPELADTEASTDAEDVEVVAHEAQPPWCGIN